MGAVYENNGEGAAYVFRRGTGGWTQAARLSEPGAQQFGDAVTVSDGGTIATVGAEAAQVTGTAYVYARSAGGWGQAIAQGGSERFSRHRAWRLGRASQ